MFKAFRATVLGLEARGLGEQEGRRPKFAPWEEDGVVNVCKGGGAELNKDHSLFIQ